MNYIPALSHCGCFKPRRTKAGMSSKNMKWWFSTWLHITILWEAFKILTPKPQPRAMKSEYLCVGHWHHPQRSNVEVGLRTTRLAGLFGTELFILRIVYLGNKIK